MFPYGPGWLLLPSLEDQAGHWTAPCATSSLSMDQHCDLKLATYPVASVSSSKEGDYLSSGSEELKESKALRWDLGWCTYGTGDQELRAPSDTRRG